MPAIGLHDIKLRPGHASLEPRLGAYYLDMSEALVLAENGHHGPLDEAGVPKYDFGAAGQFYNTTLISQYAIILHDTMLAQGRTPDMERKFVAQLNALDANIEKDGNWKGFALNRWDSPRHPELRAPWVSALSQGNILSALLRGHQLLGDGSLLDLAHLVFGALERPMSQGGARCVGRRGHLWFEEYPMDPPSHVLNGFIFALWGVLDYARTTNHKKAWDWWHDGVKTLTDRLPDYDCGYWSLYDLRERELASLYYQTNIHIPQLQVMHQLTGFDIFETYATRWEKFSASPLRRAQWWVALRVNARMPRRHRVGR